jgi:ribA/ribD-fused uncharacterized protein
MEYCAYFIKDKALFGSHPSQDSVKKLENNGVRYFVDLTCEGEKKIKPYTTEYTYIHYPLVDHKAPYDWKSFATLIIKLSKIIYNLKKDEKIYINCKAGIGRSGLVAACILCYLEKMTYEQAIEITTKCHRERLVLKDNLRKMLSPQTATQRNFVKKFFEPLYFYKAYKYGLTKGFSNFSLDNVEIEGIGKFPTSEAAYQAHKNLENKDYVIKQQESKTPTISKRLGKYVEISEEFENNKDEIMEKIIKLKFTQNSEIKESLLSTGLKIIISSDINDTYWGIGKDGQGKNMLGKILMKIRNEMYLDI